MGQEAAGTWGCLRRGVPNGGWAWLLEVATVRGRVSSGPVVDGCPWGQGREAMDIDRVGARGRWRDGDQGAQELSVDHPDEA